MEWPVETTAYRILTQHAAQHEQAQSETEAVGGHVLGCQSGGWVEGGHSKARAFVRRQRPQHDRREITRVIQQHHDVRRVHDGAVQEADPLRHGLPGLLLFHNLDAYDLRRPARVRLAAVPPMAGVVP